MKKPKDSTQRWSTKEPLAWVSLLGRYEQDGETLIFKGTTRPDVQAPAIGNFLCNRRFSGGTIRASVQFQAVDQLSACEAMLYYNPATRAFLTAGIGGAGMLYSIRYFFNQWSVLATVGEKANLEADRKYRIEASLKGSVISLAVDGVDVLQTRFPVPVPESQVGVWCMGNSDIRVSSYQVSTEIPKIFVVMEFSSPYNEIYLDVIKEICAELKLRAWRADDTFAPGVVIEDIARQIAEAKAVIAEITPANPNVYYEVGYAHALQKPTILLADRDNSSRLPFDVSPFRVLFYENSIPGRAEFADGLRRHLESIFQTREAPNKASERS